MMLEGQRVARSSSVAYCSSSTEPLRCSDKEDRGIASLRALAAMGLRIPKKIYSIFSMPHYRSCRVQVL